MIRIGRCCSSKNGMILPPTVIDGKEYYLVYVLTKSTKYGSLGPYCLTDDHGVIMENVWQMSKIYKGVIPRVTHTYSRWDRTEIWNHHPHVQIDKEGFVTDEYREWRKKGMECKYPLRYPVGYSKKIRGSCVGAIVDLPEGKVKVNENTTGSYKVVNALGYIDARKAIYLPLYVDLVKKQKQYNELQIGYHVVKIYLLLK